VAIKEGRNVWDNLRKVLFINTPINNSQGLSVLFGLLFGLPTSPLNAIQILYSNLICATTLGFVCAVEPAEEGIMKLPPRRVGKNLIGRFMFLRIVVGTVTLTGCVVGSVFWLRSLGVDKYDQMAQSALAFNVLDFGAISVTLSARFAHNSSFSTRIFRGNKWCWIAIGIFVALQLATTYIPGLNTVVFQMSPMDGVQWGITLLFMSIVFVIMETEKYIRISIYLIRVEALLTTTPKSGYLIRRVPLLHLLLRDNKLKGRIFCGIDTMYILLVGFIFWMKQKIYFLEFKNFKEF